MEKNKIRTDKYIVTGMSCAACQAHVEKAVSAVNGVDSCSVSLLTNSMSVSGNADPGVIIRAVEEAGYGASLEGDHAGKSSFRELEEQLENSVKCLKKLKTKVIPKQEIAITTLCGLGALIPVLMNNPTISYVVPGATVLTVTGLCIAEGKARSKISDIEKNKLFMENKSLFTKGKLNDNVISALRLKNTGIFASKERIELNDVDRVSLNEMKKLVENLKREETMGFDYDVPKIHAKKFTL